MYICIYIFLHVVIYLVITTHDVSDMLAKMCHLLFIMLLTLLLYHGHISLHSPPPPLLCPCLSSYPFCLTVTLIKQFVIDSKKIKKHVCTRTTHQYGTLQ